MGMGYMGYAKIGGQIFLITGSSVNEVVEPIYSDSVRGAGWYNAGVSKYSEDVVRYEGNIDFDLQSSVWPTLISWIVEARNTPQTLIISPDGMDVQTFTAGTMNGAWNSSANFSTSEGSPVSISLGVLAIARTESLSSSYIANKTGISCALLSPLNSGQTNLNPIPFWKSTPSLTVNGDSPFDDQTDAVEWGFSIDQGLTVVYACVNAQGPIAIFVGEMEASASVVMYSPNGVAKVNGSTASNTEFVVSLDGIGTMTLPKVILDQDAYDIGGGDSITSRSFSMKGLAGDNPPFMMA
jgi:hypothetical protein